MKLPLARIEEFVQGTGEVDGNLVAGGYSIDSRTMTPDQVFFAVAGERVDGHDFVEAALQAGAVAAVVRKDMLARYSVKTGLIAVDDTLAALQALAAAVRRLWGKTVVGVTGSTGKTTTKDAIAHVLSSRLNVLKSAGNLNNHFGLPLQLLRLEREHEIAVIEMGMSHAGEIRALASLAQPDIGVVTNVAPGAPGVFRFAGKHRAGQVRVDCLVARRRHCDSQCRRRVRFAIRPRFSRQSGHLWNPQARRRARRKCRGRRVVGVEF